MLVFNDYETFVINPQLLYSKDRELYDFFKEGGLLEKRDII